MLASSLLHNTTQTDKAGQHLIAAISGLMPGPTLIVVGSIHGNEPGGALAARRVAADLKAKRPLLRGEVILLSGNTRALARNVRYINTDLNRHWTAENIFAVRSEGHFASTKSENLELRELLEQFEQA